MRTNVKKIQMIINNNSPETCISMFKKFGVDIESRLIQYPTGVNEGDAVNVIPYGITRVFIGIINKTYHYALVNN